MNKITRKPRGIQTRWVKRKNWMILSPMVPKWRLKPKNMRKYKKYVSCMNKRFMAFCIKWYSELENKYFYALFILELTNKEKEQYKEIMRKRVCDRLTKSQLKKIVKHLEMTRNDKTY